MERKKTEGYYITDEELLAALDDSDFEFDDLDHDPNFVPDSEEENEQAEGEAGADGNPIEDQLGNIRPNDTGPLSDSDNENIDLDLNLSVPGPSRYPAPESLANGVYRGRGATRGRGAERGRGVERGRGAERVRGADRGRGRGEVRGRAGGRGRGQQRGGRGGRGRGRRPQAVVEWTGQTLNTDFPPFQPQIDERCNRDGWNAVQYFNEYFDDGFFDFIVEKN